MILVAFQTFSFVACLFEFFFEPFWLFLFEGVSVLGGLFGVSSILR